jgi:hypothetical protein
MIRVESDTVKIIDGTCRKGDAIITKEIMIFPVTLTTRETYKSNGLGVRV